MTDADASGHSRSSELALASRAVRERGRELREASGELRVYAATVRLRATASLVRSRSLRPGHGRRPGTPRTMTATRLARVLTQSAALADQHAARDAIRGRSEAASRERLRAQAAREVAARSLALANRPRATGETAGLPSA